MKVKQYRAATMREALEKVKGELGDDALVLSSRSIRNSGFLGIGAKNEVEVTVSTDFPPSASNSSKDSPKSAARSSTFTSLSLNDELDVPEPTLPAAPRNGGSIFAALAARTYAAESKDSAATAPESLSSTAILLEHSRNREVDTREPQKRVFVETVVPETKDTSNRIVNTPSVSVTKRDPVIAELERLRAEIREVKFTLGTFVGNGRERAQAQPGIIDADEQLYDSPFYETYLHLGGLGLEPELAKTAARAAIASGSDSHEVEELGRIGLMDAISTLVTFGSDPVALGADGRQPVIALVGPTGVGKTTTIAKLAARVALREQRRVELITVDTYRIGAVKQLKTYAEIIGAGFHVPRSILELDALIRRFSGEATVMIDTIGRSAQDLADQIEFADYLRANEQIKKCVVIQGTTHPADTQIALSKFALFGANSLVITKLDETCRAGAAIATAAAANLPLSYLCNGQRVPEDIETATAESLTACILRTRPFAIAA